MEDDTIAKRISYYFELLKFDPPDGHDSWSEYTPEQLSELYKRLAFYRIRGCEVIRNMKTVKTMQFLFSFLCHVYACEHHVSCSCVF